MKQILIVDDDPSVQDVLSEIVSTYGLGALVAVSAKEAIATLASQKVDVILLDISMPDIAGDQFLSFIRKKGFQVPVVVVSGQVDEEMEKRLKEAGISGIVRKPFEVADVIDAVEKALDN